jgi:hypothetical protein
MYLVIIHSLIISSISLNCWNHLRCLSSFEGISLNLPMKNKGITLDKNFIISSHFEQPSKWRVSFAVRILQRWCFRFHRLGTFETNYWSRLRKLNRKLEDLLQLCTLLSFCKRRKDPFLVRLNHRFIFEVG